MPKPPVAHGLVAKAPTGARLPPDYVPMAESHHVLYQIDTDAFVGPLDLLLFLCRRHQLDIFDIPMAFVCARYLEVLEAMHECSLDVAAEFMFMASELLHIKSRMLLPKEPSANEDEPERDPRAELVARLLMLQSFQEAAGHLHARPQLHRDVFVATPEPMAPQPRPLKAMDAWGLIAALDRVLKRAAPEVRHRVLVEQVPMRLRMVRLLERLSECDGPMPIDEAFNEVDNTLDVIVTFLAVLELAKRRLVRVGGEEPEPLWLQARFVDLAEAQRQLRLGEPISSVNDEAPAAAPADNEAAALVL